MMRRIAKSIAFATLGSPTLAASRLRKISDSGLLTILSLHRVAPDDSSTYPPLNPLLFRELLEFCRTHFSVVTFADLDRKNWRKPPIILSFDDGYKDFIEYSAPILAEYGLRCNHNLIPHAIATGLPPFNVILNDFAGKAPETWLARFDVPGFRKFSVGEGRHAWGNALSNWFKARPIVEQHQFAGVIIPQLGLGEKFTPTQMMSLADAREVAAVHEVGAHSFEHANLGYESDAYTMADVRKCREWFKHELHSETSIYALPNGDFRESQLSLIEAAGYSTILMVGDSFSSTRSRRHSRFNFHAAGRSEMRFKALGGVAPLRATVLDGSRDK